MVVICQNIFTVRVVIAAGRKKRLIDRRDLYIFYKGGVCVFPWALCIILFQGNKLDRLLKQPFPAAKCRKYMA